MPICFIYCWYQSVNNGSRIISPSRNIGRSCSRGNCSGAVVLEGNCSGGNCSGNKCLRWELSGEQLSRGNWPYTASTGIVRWIQIHSDSFCFLNFVKCNHRFINEKKHFILSYHNGDCRKYFFDSSIHVFQHRHRHFLFFITLFWSI